MFALARCPRGSWFSVFRDATVIDRGHDLRALLQATAQGAFERRDERGIAAVGRDSRASGPASLVIPDLSEASECSRDSALARSARVLVRVHSFKARPAA